MNKREAKKLSLKIVNAMIQADFENRSAFGFFQEAEIGGSNYRRVVQALREIQEENQRRIDRFDKKPTPRRKRKSLENVSVPQFAEPQEHRILVLCALYDSGGWLTADAIAAKLSGSMTKADVLVSLSDLCRRWIYVVSSSIPIGSWQEGTEFCLSASGTTVVTAHGHMWLPMYSRAISAKAASAK